MPEPRDEERCEHGASFADFCDVCAHQPIAEWVGYPITICQFCGVPWPCARAVTAGAGTDADAPDQTRPLRPATDIPTATQRDEQQEAERL